MLSRTILNAMIEDFNDRFDPMCKHSHYFVKSSEEVSRFVIGNNKFTTREQGDFEDALSCIVSAASCLAYYMGIQDGADMLNSITKADFTDKVLEATNDVYRFVI